ncbi:UNVERIFIED_CONTAM: hypothetical protein FKN15_009765 [Acipenser sinensis]
MHCHVRVIAIATCASGAVNRPSPDLNPSEEGSESKLFQVTNGTAAAETVGLICILCIPQRLRTRGACSRNGLPLGQALGGIHQLGDGAGKLEGGYCRLRSPSRDPYTALQSPLPEFLSVDEFVKLRRELASVNGHGGEDASLEDDIPPGIEDITDPAKLITEIENMRHRVIESRQEVFNHNEHEVSKRWTFEEGIKRPYFHVKPLEKAQLNNWKEYLDFEIENGTPERVAVLFERCLVACALYEEFWVKVITRLDRVSEYFDLLRNIEEARGILKTFEEAVPGLAMVRLRRVSLERRHGNLEEAESLLREAIKNGKTASVSSFYSIKLARLLFKVQKSLQRAREVLLEAIQRDESPKLYLNLLEIEFSGDLKLNEEHILSCFDRAVNSSLPVETRISFSQRKVEFLEDFGFDVTIAQEPEEKKQRAEDTTVETGQMMGGDMQANQSAYNYSSWYQYNYQNPWSYGQYYPPPPT